MAEDGEEAPDAVGNAAAEAAAAAKEAGNEALRSADLPLAIERYEEAVRLLEGALAAAAQPKVLRNNDLVRYGEGRFATIDTAHPHFGDYVLMDLGTRNLVKMKVGRYEEVSKHFLRKDLHSVPQALFDLRLACLQNLTLVSLKLARATLRASDFEEVVRRADEALAMDGRSAKALMRKGAALIGLKDVDGAAKALAVAHQETRGRDAEVARLLETVLEAKGKGKGRGKGAKGRRQLCGGCGDPECLDGSCAVAPESPSDSEPDLPAGPETPEAPAATPARLGEAPQPRRHEEPGSATASDSGAPAASTSGAAGAVVPGAAPAEAAKRPRGGPQAPPRQSVTSQRWPVRLQVVLAMATLAVVGTAALLLRPGVWDGSEQEVEL